MLTEPETADRDSGVLLRDLVAGHPALTIVGDRATRVTGLTFDSRAVVPGDLFVALRGSYTDGHQHAPQAVAKGARALLVEQRLGLGPPEIVAPNSRAALAAVAAAFYGRPSERLHVIGITGTDGKTTTSYLVDAILRQAGRRTGMVSTVSVRIGDELVDHETRQTTPESADVQRHLRHMVDAGTAWAILEATSHGLDLHRLDEVRFEIAAVTNITHEHLEHHRTVDAYRRAKGLLFERAAAAGGTAIVNLDDAGAKSMLPFCAGARLLTYSTLGAAADLFASDVRLAIEGSTFRLRAYGADEVVKLPLPGAFNVANALCAAAIATAAEIPFSTIVEALGRAPVVPGRMARIDVGQPFSVIVDYAHTPESLAKVLELVRVLNPQGRIIAVSGSAGERDVEKRPLQGKVSARMAETSIFTTEDPRFEDPDAIIADIAAGAMAAGGIAGETYYCITDRRDAIHFAIAQAKPNDVVVLAGKGHERSIIWGQEKRPWDEAAVVREALIELGFGRDT